MNTDIPLGLTFDDVLLVPQYSDIASRKDVSLKTRLTKNIELNMPLISSNMDTVTESRMCIEMAKLGGIGILHRYCSIEEQVNMVKQVKRAGSYIITDPYLVSPNTTIGSIRELSKLKNVNSFLVTNTDSIIIGILTKRDVKGRLDTDLVKDCMSMSLVTAQVGTTMDEAKQMMIKKRIQKLPIIRPDSTIHGLICLKDIERIQEKPHATVDSQGRLRCGAAVGVNKDYWQRTEALIEANVDVICLDIAHGHSEHAIRTIKEIRAKYPHIDIIGGNIATASGALDLILAGVDGLKIGVGSGSICSTRLNAGSGIPQLSALLDVAPVCKKFGVPLITDGGNRNSGNMAKALAFADTIMLGRLLAGSDASPGRILIKNNKRVKLIRGMASFEAFSSFARKQGLQEPNPDTFHSEGVEAYTDATGPLEHTLNQFLGGIRSGFSYSGARTIQEFQQKAKFIRITGNGNRESGIHDVIM
jgi:IMP dehydrogenase